MNGEAVDVLRAAAAVDEYDDATSGADTETTIEGVAVAPRYSSEDNDRRSAVIVGVTCYFPPGSDVLPTDRLRVRGVIYRVDGEPGSWINPFTSADRGLEVAAQRVTG